MFSDMKYPDQVICLWSGPRNVSTALMYAFRQHADVRVIDEPLYAHYLRVTGAIHPGGEEVLATQNNDGNEVVHDVIMGACDCPILFVKNMAHHLVDLNLGFLDCTRNIFLIRDPEQMLPSLINQIPNPTIRDTGLKRQCDLLQELESRGQQPVVLDSKELLLNPASILNQLCSNIGISFSSALLSWPEGPKPEDGVWAKHWYHSVHKSTTFAEYKAKESPFPEFLTPLLEECMPFYETLYARALKASE